MNRKQTAWKKSRKFGDIYGGRVRLRLSDNIFQRAHSLKKPAPDDPLPILIEDNPSRDFFFPVTVHEVYEAMKALPEEDYAGITHLWLRRIKKSDYEKGNMPLAEFICGSGIRAIILYPWPKNMLQYLGSQKPSRRKIIEYGKYGVVPVNDGKNWVMKWQTEQLRKFYINHLLYHEVGHHIDWYFRHWSKANSKQQEEFADQYAMQKTATETYVLDRLSGTVKETP